MVANVPTRRALRQRVTLGRPPSLCKKKIKNLGGPDFGMTFKGRWRVSHYREGRSKISAHLLDYHTCFKVCWHLSFSWIWHFNSRIFNKDTCGKSYVMRTLSDLKSCEWGRECNLSQFQSFARLFEQSVEVNIVMKKWLYRRLYFGEAEG